MGLVLAYNNCEISIHALLAESDGFGPAWLAPGAYFYPRSPCGERRPGRLDPEQAGRISIHALLAESDRKRRGALTIS